MESPLAILMMGGLLVVLLLAGWLKTGDVRVWGCAFAAVLATALLLLVEALVVTTREAIDVKLRSIASDLVAGAEEQILAAIASDAQDLRREAQRWLAQVTFHEARVKRNLTVAHLDPQTVRATFNAVVVVSDRAGTVDRHHIPSHFVVDLVREADDWKVVRYERRDPRDGVGQQHRP